MGKTQRGVAVDARGAERLSGSRQLAGAAFRPAPREIRDNVLSRLITEPPRAGKPQGRRDACGTGKGKPALFRVG